MPHGQEGLDAVDPEGDIQTPAGKIAGRDIGKGHYQAGDADNRNPPEHGPVIEFFPVSPAVKLRQLAES